MLFILLFICLIVPLFGQLIEERPEVIEKLVNVIVKDLKTEFTADTIQTKLQLLFDVVSKTQISATSARAVIKWLDEDVSRSFDEHEWKQEKLYDNGLSYVLPIVSATIKVLVEKEVASIQEATTLTNVVKKAAQTMIKLSAPDEEAFTFDDDVMFLVAKKVSNQRLEDDIFSSEEINVSNLKAALDDGKVSSSAIGIMLFGLRGGDLYGSAPSRDLMRSLVVPAGLYFFDSENEELRLFDQENPVQLTFALNSPMTSRRRQADTNEENEVRRNQLECVWFDIDTWVDDGCSLSDESTDLVAICDCTHVTGAFAVRVKPVLLPDGDGPLTDRALPLRRQGDSDQWLWLLLLLLLLLCCTLLIVGCLVRRHRSKKEEDADTLQPYLDKAAGMGTLGLLAGGAADDVSDSSELERRDYNLPVGVYEIPEATNSSDLAREDFSMALSDESDDSELENLSSSNRKEKSYKKETRLKSGNVETVVARDALKTDIDVSASIEASQSQSIPLEVGTEKELQRTKTAAARD